MTVTSQAGLIELARKHANLDSVRLILAELDLVKFRAEQAHSKLANVVQLTGKALAGAPDHFVAHDQRFVVEAAYEVATLSSQYAMLALTLNTALSAAGIETGF